MTAHHNGPRMDSEQRPLSPRKQSILDYFGDGYAVWRIRELMNLSRSAMNKHVHELMGAGHLRCTARGQYELAKPAPVVRRAVPESTLPYPDKARLMAGRA